MHRNSVQIMRYYKFNVKTNLYQIQTIVQADKSSLCSQYDALTCKDP